MNLVLGFKNYQLAYKWDITYTHVCVYVSYNIIIIIYIYDIVYTIANFGLLSYDKKTTLTNRIRFEGVHLGC